MTRALRIWQAIAIVAVVACIALAVPLARQRAAAPIPPQVAVLKNAEGRTGWLVTASPRGEAQLQLRVMVGAPDVLTDRVYELWVLRARNETPASLGILPKGDTTFDVKADLVPALRSGGRLGVSIEPAGGSQSGKPAELVYRGELGLL